MKIKFNTDEVVPKLKTVASVVNQKSVIPVLSNILFETEEDGQGGTRIKMTGSDGDTYVTMTAPIVDLEREDTKEIRFCIDAKRIVSTLGNLGESVVEMTFKAQMARINYDNGHFELPYEDAFEYPNPKEDEDEKTEKNINARRLAIALAQTECAVSNDTLRPVMCGIHFDFFSSNMVAVSTDSKILVKHTDKTIKGVGQDSSFTMPTKPAHILLGMLQKIEDDVAMSFTQKNVKVTCPHFTLVTRLIDGRYPRYDAVIPTNNDKTATIGREQMLSALRRIIPLGNDTTNIVKFSFSNGQVVLSSENLDFSTSATERLTCDYSGEPITIGFNGNKVIMIVSNIKAENVKIAMSDPKRAALVTPNEEGAETEDVSLIMPMMLQ